MYNINIPVKHKDGGVYVKPINTFLQKEICKGLLNDSDDLNIIHVFNNVLKECITPSINIFNLNIIEKLIILIRLRSISIGQNIPLIAERDNKKINIEYNLLKILEEIYNIYKQIDSLSLQINEKTTLYCNIPFINYEKDFLGKKKEEYNVEDYLIYFIEKIDIKDRDTVYFCNIDKQSQQQIYNKLPAYIISNIYTFAQDLYKKFNNINFYNFLDYNLKINLFNLSINEYLKFIYKEDLQNIYYSLYAMCKYLNMTPEYVENLTPLERELYMNFYKQEQQKNSSTSESIPINSKTEDIDIFKNIKGG